ncbi:uncharacterized protein si:ch211-191i18.2 [Hoplias malabaricus]|uniref:uncharacterized protein si:ch211-191i18.2 n=1 Tax=Hoplias malabaricus TaxID=27720 RepID=UPI003462E7D0
MPRLPHHCLIAVCLAGSLLLLPLYCAGEEDLSSSEYYSTSSPEYDYNSTFEISFFSNASAEDLERFLSGPDTTEEETETDTSLITDTTFPTFSPKGQASRTVHCSFLLTVVLTAHQFLRFL